MSTMPTYHGGPDTVFARWVRAKVVAPEVHDTAPRLCSRCTNLRCTSLVFGHTRDQLAAALDQHLNACRWENR